MSDDASYETANVKLPRSIRGRFQLWLGFLLVCVLSGFGLTAHRLYRSSLLEQVDAELSRRVAALSADIHSPPMERPPRGDGPDGRSGDRRRPADGPRRRPPPDDTFEWPDESGETLTGSGREPFRRGPGRPPGGFRGGPGGPGGPEGLSGPRSVRLSSMTASLFAAQDPMDFYFVVWARGGTLIRATTNAPMGVVVPHRVRGDTTPHFRTRESWREVYRFTELGDCALVGRSIAPGQAALTRFSWLLLAGGAGVLAFGLGGGWWLVGRALQPVHDISAAATRIADGNLAERINAADARSELGRLAALLNSTFARLETAFSQQKQFTADAAHELRTPIAVLIAEAQTALSRPRSPEEYRETVRECLVVAQQMRRLTESLLELARFDAGQERLERGAFDLAETARVCVDLVRPLAAERQVTVKADLAPAVVAGDSDRLNQVLTNLVTNAIHYNREGGTVRVSTRRERDEAVLVVADTGPGIAPEELPRLFERFYRGDKSRARASGHCGLGLAISRAIVLAHGGQIAVASEVGSGATFTVRLPAGA